MSALGILGVFAILCVYWLYFGADTFSWHLVLPRVPITPSWYFRLFAVRMIGEAYNNITPTASLGGEPIKAWLLKSNWGISLRHSGSSLVVAKTTSMFSLVVFVGIGALLLAYHPNLTPRLESIVLWGLVFMVLSSVVLFLAQRFGFLTWAARSSEKLLKKGSFKQTLVAIQDIDRQFQGFYEKDYKRLVGSCCFAMLNWVLGVCELYLIMHLLGFSISFSEVWIIECLVQLVRTLTFFIPGGISTQEAAFMLAVGALVGSPSMGVIAALIRRCRDLIWISASLVLSAFYSVTPSSLSEIRQERDIPTEHN